MQIKSGSGQVSYSYYTDKSGVSAEKPATATDNQTASSDTAWDSPAAIYEPSTSSPSKPLTYTKPMMAAQAVSTDSLTAEESSAPADPQAIYDQWIDDFESAFQDYSADLYQTIDQDAAFFSNEDKNALNAGIDSWFQSKRGDLETLLADADETSKAAFLQTADDELSTRKQTFHAQAGARIDFAVWNETLTNEAATMSQQISDTIRQNPDRLTTSDLEQLIKHIDEWSTNMQQQLRSKMEAYPSEIHDDFILQGEQKAVNIGLAILNVMSDTLTLRDENETAANKYHQNWLNDLNKQASSFLSDASKQLNSLSKISTQDLDQLNKKLDQWLTEQQSSYSSGLVDQVDASMVGVLNKYGSISADKLSNLRSSIWASVTNLTLQHQQNNASSVVKEVDPKTVFSSGYNKTTYEYGLGEGKVTMKLDKVSSSNSDTTWCYVVDANGQKRALSLSFANDSITEKMRQYFKDSKAFGSTISLEKLNSLMDKMRSTASSFDNVNWDLLKSKVFGSGEKTKLSNWLYQMSNLFISMKA